MTQVFYLSNFKDGGTLIHDEEDWREGWILFMIYLFEVRLRVLLEKYSKYLYLLSYLFEFNTYVNLELMSEIQAGDINLGT